MNQYSPAMKNAAALLMILLAAPLGAQEFDLVFRNARLVDGTGAPATTGDLAIRGDRLAAVGRDRKSTRLNSSHVSESRMPSSA